MLCPRMMRLAPTVSATSVIGVIWATGMPALSISVVIAAPLRVLVPQVEVSITASTPASFSLSAISRPMRRLFSKGLPLPVVEKNSSCSLPI